MNSAIIEGLSVNQVSIPLELCKKEHCHGRCLQKTHRSTEYTRPNIAGMTLFAESPHNRYGRHQTVTACSWLVCHSRGEHCANCIHLPRLSGGPAAQFFGEASRAFTQHGWRSAYSLRETWSPTQDQNQH